VRGLYGVVEEKRATQGLIVTTSYFTKDAIAFRDRLPYRLSLADFDRLTTFLRQWRTR
jgi:restriction endonuclease Mrr